MHSPQPAPHFSRIIIPNPLRRLDERVSEVCRKEQTAGKLSKEWEERIELMERKDRGEDVGGELREKEGRIRTLSKLMGKGNTRKVELLMSTDFRRLCGGDVGVDEAERGMRNLFGMVVRERKRVMGLATKVKEMEKEREEIEGMKIGVKEDKFMLEVEVSRVKEEGRVAYLNTFLANLIPSEA